MWQLSMTNVAKEWTEVGAFDTVTAAAGRIREIEGFPDTSFFLEVRVDHGTDDEVFSILRHTGREANYCIRRLPN
jgi:hypothetical protein